MTPYLTVAGLVLVVVVQTTVMPAASLGSVKPFLPLLVVVSWGLLRGPLEAAWWALALGLALDIVSPSPMLFYTLPLLAVLVVVRLGRGSMFPGNVVMPWLVAALATVAFALLQRALLPLLGGAVRFGPEALGREILPEVALNLLWLPLAFFPLRALARHYGAERIEWER